MKASSKVETTVSMDCYGFIYQMKAYSAMIGIITGKNSFVLVQLKNLVHSIKKIRSMLQARNFPRQMLPREIQKCSGLSIPPLLPGVQEVFGQRRRQ
jgi:hypothetical protein